MIAIYNYLIKLISQTWFFYLFVFVIHIVGLLIAINTGSIYLVDSIDYLSQADNIIEHGSLYAAPWMGEFKPDYFTFRPPLYGLFIALIKLISSNDYLVLFFQSIISISTIWGIKKWLDENFLIKANKYLIVLLLVYPSQVIHCNFIMSDIMFQSLIFWAFYHTYKLWHFPSYQNAIKMSLFFILAMLAKPVAYLMGLSAGAIFLFYFIKKSKTKYLLPLLSIPIIYHTYCNYNKHITGHYHYSTVTPIFVLKYMGKYTNALVYGENYADSVQEIIMQKANQMSLADRYDFMNKSGKDMIMAHPNTFLLSNVKGWIAFMIDPGRFEWVHFLNLEEGEFLGLYHVINTKGIINGIGFWLKNAPLSLLCILFFCLIANVVISVLFLRFLFEPKFPIVLRLMIFLFFGYIIAATGVLGLSRYRIAVASFLWIASILVYKRKQYNAKN